MNDDNQFVIPPSFIALYVPPGKTRPSATREVIAARYEFCEDMATMLTEHARAVMFELDADEALVLDRVLRGLLVEGSVVDPSEARWVVVRLAELLGWPFPETPAC
jgi:hypothetical protein